MKYFEIVDHLKSAWKTNLNGPPTPVLQCKTQISGTRQQLLISGLLFYFCIKIIAEDFINFKGSNKFTNDLFNF